VLNRFVVQAVAGHPLTVYGAGGQTRGMLNIRDTLACVELAVLNPPSEGEYRVFNQFTESFSIMELADKVVEASGGKAEIATIPNPRVEREDHYYRAAHTKLLDLGLVPHLLDRPTVAGMLATAERNRNRIDPDTIAPRADWREASGRAEKAESLSA
jgi:UDP-sulfoquinovose synthase